MEQENITFHEYLLTKRGKEVHLSSDLCFKYAMQNQEVASLVLNTLGFTVRPEDITIRSEIGTGIHIRCTGEHRFDMEILDFQSQTTYDFELQNYKENISFKMTIKLLERIISDFDIKKNEVKDIDDLPITHLIVLDNYTKNLNYNYEEIAIMKKLEDTFREYYKGKIMIHHLQCNVKNDKMKLGKERFERYKKFLDRRNSIEKLITETKEIKITPKNSVNEYLSLNGKPVINEKISGYEFLKRPDIDFFDLEKVGETIFDYESDIKEQALIEIKYSGYIQKAYKEAHHLEMMESRKIPSDINYDEVNNLALEAREKLKKVNPQTIAQASRISGVNPSDITMLLVYLESKYGTSNK